MCCVVLCCVVLCCVVVWCDWLGHLFVLTLVLVFCFVVVLSLVPYLEGREGVVVLCVPFDVVVVSVVDVDLISISYVSYALEIDSVGECVECGVCAFRIPCC